MLRDEDFLIVIAITVLFIAWMTVRLKKWLTKAPPPPVNPHPIALATEENASAGALGAYLIEEGYNIVSPKKKVLIKINSNDKELVSRIFVDCIAEKDGETYLVRTAKERKKMNQTGSSIRDMLLSYYLMYYKQVAGVLYVDHHQRKITTVKFSLEIEVKKEEDQASS